jgi:hypothetical protein
MKGHVTEDKLRDSRDYGLHSILKAAGRSMPNPLQSLARKRIDHVLEIFFAKDQFCRQLPSAVCPPWKPASNPGMMFCSILHVPDVWENIYRMRQMLLLPHSFPFQAIPTPLNATHPADDPSHV